MTERPILFSGTMVKAILDGRKTMTRRVVKPQPGKQAGLWRSECEWLSGECAFIDPQLDPPEYFLTCPYGIPGDRLWVRETWADFDVDGDDPRRVVYRVSASDADGLVGGYKVKWRPSIFMPRWASRVTLEIEAVRVERVQEITEADAMAEGCEEAECKFCADPQGVQGAHCNCDEGYRESFRALWDSINAKRGYGWDVNPWVWVIQFRRLQ